VPRPGVERAAPGRCLPQASESGAGVRIGRVLLIAEKLLRRINTDNLGLCCGAERRGWSLLRSGRCMHARWLRVFSGMPAVVAINFHVHCAALVFCKVYCDYVIDMCAVRRVRWCCLRQGVAEASIRCLGSSVCMCRQPMTACKHNPAGHAC